MKKKTLKEEDENKENAGVGDDVHQATCKGEGFRAVQERIDQRFFSGLAKSILKFQAGKAAKRKCIEAEKHRHDRQNTK
ncbi:MAG: hypothetical protein ACYSOL_02145 [Planctomycetota bacterium]